MLHIDTLISEVYKRTAIWDKMDKSHGNRNILDKCWKEISQKMAVDGNVLRKKWKYLRDQYSVELGKIPPPRSGDAANEVSTPKWPYFSLLSFLKDTVKARQSKGNCSTQLLDKQTLSVETGAGPSDEWQPPVEQYVNLTAGDYEVVEQPSDNTSEVQRKYKKRKVSQTDTYNLEMVNIKKEKLQFLKEKTTGREKRYLEDEDLYFFKSLLPHVRRIPPSSKLAFRGLIQEVVDEFAYRQRPISASSHSRSSSPFSLSFPISPDIPPNLSPVPDFLPQS